MSEKGAGSGVVYGVLVGANGSYLTRYYGYGGVLRAHAADVRRANLNRGSVRADN